LNRFGYQVGRLGGEHSVHALSGSKLVCTELSKDLLHTSWVAAYRRAMTPERAARIVEQHDRAHRKYYVKRQSLVGLGRAIAVAIQEHKTRIAATDREFAASSSLSGMELASEHQESTRSADYMPKSIGGSKP
jgi:hypothetical protein